MYAIKNQSKKSSGKRLLLIAFGILASIGSLFAYLMFYTAPTLRTHLEEVYE